MKFGNLRVQVSTLKFIYACHFISFQFSSMHFNSCFKTCLKSFVNSFVNSLFNSFRSSCLKSCVNSFFKSCFYSFQNHFNSCNFIPSFVCSFVHSFMHSFLSFHSISLLCIAFHSIHSFSLSLSLSLCLRRYCSANDWPCLRSEVRFGKYCRSCHRTFGYFWCPDLEMSGTSPWHLSWQSSALNSIVRSVAGRSRGLS